MPIKINLPTAEDYAKIDSRFDACVRRLAPIIWQLREEDPRRSSTRKLADRLNARGELGPNGKAISYSTMRRILVRLPQMRLGGGTRDRKVAANNRITPPWPPSRPRRRIKSDWIKKALRGVLADIASVEAARRGTDDLNH